MANTKKVALIFSKANGAKLLKSENPHLVKIVRKGTVAPLRVEKDLRTEVGAGAPAGEMLWDAVKGGGLVVDELCEGSNLTVLDLDTEAEIADALDKAFALGSHKLIVVIVCPDMVFFYGMGVERNQILEKPVAAMSVAPTICWLADYPLPAQVEAAPIYKAFKGLNFKANEISKMNDSIEALMLNIERANRKPWDKHDCA